MKGQYLAIESVLTIGMGIALATGTTTLFNNYKADVLATGEEKQALTVNARVQSAINELRECETGSVTVKLPDTIGGSSYLVTGGENIVVNTGDKTYNFKIVNAQYEINGTVSGGPVKVFKRKNKIELRPE